MKYKYSVFMIDKSQVSCGSSNLYLIGPFNNWKPQKMLKLYDFCDMIKRNTFQCTRYFIKPNGTLFTKIAKVTNEDVYKSTKRAILLRHDAIPTISKLIHRKELENKMQRDQFLK